MIECNHGEIARAILLTEDHPAGYVRRNVAYYTTMADLNADLRDKWLAIQKALPVIEQERFDRIRDRFAAKTRPEEPK